ncbi:MAG: 5-formyltetrahydrofolate cyclo-ligase [Treponemataceae bacterium]|nr:5-formyltetrahydrofolate cyclo-ligase [Treponemataceae bacterium]
MTDRTYDKEKTAEKAGKSEEKSITAVKKAQLRASMRKKLASFRESDLYDEYSQKAALLFLSSDLYKKAPMVLAFVSLKREIDTHFLIERMMQDKKKIAVPETGDTSMTFRLLSYDLPIKAQLQCGNYGIEEPIGELVEIEPDKLPEGSVILVPGLAFSKEGARLGKGKGYYDRYISLIPDKTILAGYAFNFQLSEEIPCEDHDKKVCCIITEEKIIACSG